MENNYPPGAKDRSDAPYNYDPEQVLVECDHCGEFVTVAIAEECNGFNFCADGKCLDLFFLS